MGFNRNALQKSRDGHLDFSNIDFFLWSLFLLIENTRVTLSDFNSFVSYKECKVVEKVYNGLKNYLIRYLGNFSLMIHTA